MLDRKGGAVESDRDLILACREGRSGAWRRLLNKYQRLVYSIPLRYGLSREDAADVAQVTFGILVRSIDDLPVDSRLGAWLATVSKRHTWRRLESNRRQGGFAGELDEKAELAEDAALLGRDDAGSIEHWELTEWLEWGLSRTGKPCRDLLRALYLQPEQPTHAEVAELLGMPVGSIGPTRARCLERLRQTLG